ncbi:putative molybdopterin biosynthesis protein [Colletotrichum chlorophyti]|uniref:molybdopterin adenylyltransferase n=1 Tax=Colletotrichum chlorophyti TaxID=708187 RepID=A0A1Q8RYZ0_9PEZI|nr:putative molybdopterin biosynthesis protein [Colletotrichum chlorophyti]
MTSYAAALDVLQDAAYNIREADRTNRSVVHEVVSLEQAVGRIAATDIVSPTATPRFDTSAMDGYAVRSEATKFASPENPLFLHVCGTIAAGDAPAELSKEIFQGSLEPCFELMTGGIFPRVAGAKKQLDACVRVEDTGSVSGPRGQGRRIMVTRPVPPNADRRFAGCDIQLGQRILLKGETIRYSHILPLASVGISEVCVLKKPRVAVWSTGKELASGNVSTIPDVNGPFLMAGLREAGADPTFLGVLRDTQAEVREAIQDTVDGGHFDMILTTGGVSVGKFDFVASTLRKIGGKIHFHGVSIRPGHPVLFAQVPGRSRDMPFFGLPGNPGATAACFRFLVVPFLRYWNEQPAETPMIAKCDDDISSKGGHCTKAASPGMPPMTRFRHGILQQTPNGEMSVRLSKQQSPAKLGPYIDANCWVQLGGQRKQTWPEGSVACYPMAAHHGI